MLSVATGIAPGAPPEQSDVCLLCNSAVGGVNHLLSGYWCPAIKTCNISSTTLQGLQSLPFRTCERWVTGELLVADKDSHHWPEALTALVYGTATCRQATTVGAANRLALDLA